MKTTFSKLALSLMMIGGVYANTVHAEEKRTINEQSKFEIFGDSGRVTVAYQNGLAYLPMSYLTRFYNEEAKKIGLEKPDLRLQRVGGPGPVIEGLKGGSFDFGTVGANAVPTLAVSGYKMAAAMGDMSIALNVNNPEIKSFADLKAGRHWIAVPTRRTSIQSDLMGMAWEKVHGSHTYMDANGVTAGVDHLRAVRAMLRATPVYVGEDGIETVELTGHFATPPYQYTELKNKNVRTLITSDQILGGASTFQTLVGSEKYVASHPKTYQALVNALERSMEYINTHKKEVAEEYAKANSTENATAADILAELNDSSIKFTTVPHNIMKYADYAVKVGNLKKKPASWKELTFPNLHDKAGS